MSYSFAALCAGYEADLARMTVTRAGEVNETAERLLKYLDHYQPVTAKDGVPAVFIASSFEREASSNFRDNPAQGDPLDRVSHNVPRGMGPYTGPNAWVNAAIDAYHLDDLDKVGAGNWTWPRFCYEGEKFNGFGPRMRGHKTGYLWSGTNIYTGGKYVSDGVWSSSARDDQLGIVPMAKRMVELDPSLDLGAVIGALVSTPIVQDSAPALNKLGASLTVDGSLGANTRRAIRAFQRAHGLEADGVAGHGTWKMINTVLAPQVAINPASKIAEQPDLKAPTVAEAAMAFLQAYKH
jgi:lysozyme family protein